MRQLLRLLILVPLWIGCQSNDPAEFGIEPDHVAYNDEAPLTKKVFCNDGSCKSPAYEERYTYNAAGKLSKVETFSNNASGKLEMQSYTDYTFDANGVPTGKTQYGKHSPVSGWIPQNISEFVYEDGLLKVEKNYFHRQADQIVFTGSVENEYKDGMKVGQKWLDDHNKLFRRVQYGYQSGVLNLETWYDDKNNVIRIFKHKFSGNRRQIGEYLVNSTELLAVIEKTYDEKGRLATQETKVYNMLLCAMTPGMIRYSY